MVVASNRRGFLRGLASLPLIGGGVTLIGNPTQAAVPVTDDLLLRYRNFLATDLRETVIELHRRSWIDNPLSWPRMRQNHEISYAERFDGLPPAVADQAGVMARAAVILSAAGMPIA